MTKTSPLSFRKILEYSPKFIRNLKTYNVDKIPDIFSSQKNSGITVEEIFRSKNPRTAGRKIIICVN